MAVNYYPRPARRHEQAHQIWSIVSSFVAHGYVGRMKKPGLITYGELAQLMGYPIQAGYTMSQALGCVATFCLAEGLPPLNVVVVNVETGKPGDDVILDETRSLEDQQKSVIEFPWFSVRQPSMKAFRKAMAES